MAKRNIFYDKYAKAKKRLFALTVVAVFVLLGSGIGVLKLSNLKAITLGLETIVNDRVMPLKYLKVISDMYSINIVDTAHKVLIGNMSWSQGRQRVEDATKNISKLWNEYTSTYLVDEEKKLIIEIVPLLKRADTATMELRDILQSEDRRMLSQFLAKDLYQNVDPALEKIGSLFHIQISIAKCIHDEEKLRYRFSKGLGIASIAAGMLLGLFLALMRGAKPRFGI